MVLRSAGGEETDGRTDGVVRRRFRGWVSGFAVRRPDSYFARVVTATGLGGENVVLQKLNLVEDRPGRRRFYRTEVGV